MVKNLIPQETIAKIFDSADIVDVISDFVNLKKSGSNFKGLSPFSNEKTPSFMVSPAKGIFKDFSSGKGGNVVTFLMEHDQLNYPEALKWLARKYNIEIIEEELSNEQIAANNSREGLYLAQQYANAFFKDQLFNSDEGKSIGLSYFKSRGYLETTIKEFELGYSPLKMDALHSKAIKDGYAIENLEKAGLVKKSEKGWYDFYRGRVIFPIHNITGRIIGFGGRTLRTDKKVAKYFNSPESEIYNKSKVLYGMYQAKNSIIKEDCCFLVEGYTDVISMNKSGIKNVVSSSGTSLTEGQIRLIKRFTNNIIILYDGDAAGINASFRGIDLVLKQGLTVKVIVFPENEDPDSYSNKISTSEFQNFLYENQKDFLTFKAEMLLNKAKKDPVKIAETIKDIVSSIAIIPDPITRSIFIKSTSQTFDIDEQMLIQEVNKKLKKISPSNYSPSVQDNSKSFLPSKAIDKGVKHKLDTQEKDLIRLMLNYGSLSIPLEIKSENGETSEEQYPLAQFIIEEMLTDNLNYNNSTYQNIFNEFVDGLENGLLINDQHFIQNPNLTSLVVDLTTSENTLSENWEKKHQIQTKTEPLRLKQAAIESVFIYKLRVTENLILEKQMQLKEFVNSTESDIKLEEINELMKVRNIFAKELGIIITQ
ncbi:MAG: DNA primase [Crocinitomicaceae bacterium]|nr:DNA primase [Crocinitomicaceae bacterium]